MAISKTSKLLQYVNYRMRVTVTDGKQIIGKFMAYDRHLNLVLGDSEEYRKLPPKKGQAESREERRVLGLVLLRGEEVISMTIEGPPPADENRIMKQQLAQAGPGRGVAVGRGMPVSAPGQAQPGLAGPGPTGLPNLQMMQPRPQIQTQAQLKPQTQSTPQQRPNIQVPQQQPPQQRPSQPQQLQQQQRPPMQQQQQQFQPRPGMVPPQFPPGQRPGGPPGGAPGGPPQGGPQGMFRPGMPPGGGPPQGMPPGMPPSRPGMMPGRPGMPPGMRPGQMRPPPGQGNPPNMMPPGMQRPNMRPQGQ